MKNTDFFGQRADDLLTAVSIYLSPEIAASVTDHYGDPYSAGNFERDEMADDLISKLNDRD